MHMPVQNKDPLLNKLETLKQTANNTNNSNNNSRNNNDDEKKQRESAIYYRTIFENTGTATLIVSKDHIILKINSMFEAVLGYSKADLEGKHLTSFVTAESADLMMKNHLLRQQDPASALQNYEIEVYNRDGNIRTLICSVSIVPDSQDSIVSLRDVTEQRQAEKALRHHAEAQELLLKISKEFTNIIDFDMDEKINGALQLLGEFEGDDRCYVFQFSADETTVTNTHEWCAAGIPPAINRNANVPVENIPWHMDKLRRLEILSVSCIDDLPIDARAEREIFLSQAIQSLLVVPMVRDDTLIGFLGLDSVKKTKTWSEESINTIKLAAQIFANALRRKQYVTAIRESESYYRTIFNSAGIPAVILDEDMSVTMANCYWEKVLGYKTEEIIGADWTKCVAADSVETIKKYHRLRRVDPTAVPSRYDVRLKDKQGKDRHGLLNADIIPGTKKSVITFIDLSEFKRISRAREAISAGNMAMLHSTNERKLLNNVCQKIVEIGGYRFAWVGYIENNEEQTVRPMAYAGYKAEYLKTINISLKDPIRGSGPAGTAIRTGQLVICKDVAADPNFIPWREEALRHGYKSVIAIPLLANGGEPFGVLTIYSEDANIFDDEEERLLTEMANDLAFGIMSLRARGERNQYAKNLEINYEKMQRILNQTVGALATALEIRDPYTAGHQRRVSQLATAIAEEMGLSKDQVEGIFVAGSIHDIGKIYVPSEILSKPGKLSELEFTLVKTHCQAGYDIVKEIEFPWPVADIILQHHEKINGSGYPHGLTDPEILIEVKILMVADVVEAMASHRPYRPSLGIDAALEEIFRNKGILYDPEVVDACIRLFLKGFKLV